MCKHFLFFPFFINIVSYSVGHTWMPAEKQSRHKQYKMTTHQVVAKCTSQAKIWDLCRCTFVSAALKINFSKSSRRLRMYKPIYISGDGRFLGSFLQPHTDMVSAVVINKVKALLHHSKAEASNSNSQWAKISNLDKVAGQHWFLLKNHPPDITVELFIWCPKKLQKRIKLKLCKH